MVNLRKYFGKWMNENESRVLVAQPISKRTGQTHRETNQTKSKTFSESNSGVKAPLHGAAGPPEIGSPCSCRSNRKSLHLHRNPINPQCLDVWTWRRREDEDKGRTRRGRKGWLGQQNNTNYNEMKEKEWRKEGSTKKEKRSIYDGRGTDRCSKRVS